MTVLKIILKGLFYGIYSMAVLFLLLFTIGYKWGLTDEEKEELKDLFKGKKDQWKYRKYSKII